MEALPHLVLDGGLLAAQAVGADELIVCRVRVRPMRASSSIAQAIAERATHARGLRARAAPHGRPRRLRRRAGVGARQPSRTAVRRSRRSPRRCPSSRAYDAVQRSSANAETLAHVALIARHGAAWFRQLGTPSQPGSALVTLAGAVAHPGVYEIEHGASLAVADRGRGRDPDHQRSARALLLGGYGGNWIDGAPAARRSALRRTPRRARRLARRGRRARCSPRMPARSPKPRASRAGLRVRAPRQCGPCVHGLDALATAVEEIAGGVAPARRRRSASPGSRRWCAAAAPAAIPTAPLNLSSSALDAFAAEFADHARHGPASGCAHPAELPLPAAGRVEGRAGQAEIAGEGAGDEPPRARQPDRLRGARHVRRAAARADHARRVGLSDRR